MQQSSAEESESSEDEDLLEAASAWAQNEEEEKRNQGEPPASAKNGKPIRDKGGGGDKLAPFHSTTTSEDVSPTTFTKQPMHTNTSSVPQTYSLHLTKVPYAATQTDIRFAFGQKGCNITSIRLVYDRDQKTGEKHFRGVAFVDLADEKSYKRGLEFHNKPFLGSGRKVNVRPTRTKNELSEIVRKTEEKVATLIARSKENAQTKKRERGEDDSGTEGSSKNVQHEGNGRNSNKKRKKNKKSKSSDGSDNKSLDGTSLASSAKSKSKSNMSDTAKGTSKGEKDGKRKPNPKSNIKKRVKSEKKNADGTPIKLTKKQRAKKAAVIRMMKFKGKKK